MRFKHTKSLVLALISSLFIVTMIPPSFAIPPVLYVPNKHPNYYFYLEPFFSPYNDVIGSAMEQWHNMNPNTVKFRQVSNIYVNLDLYIVLSNNCQSWYVGLYSARDHMIVICTEYNNTHLDKNTIYEIALHELGHGLGFHHDNSTDIMNPNLISYYSDDCHIDNYDQIYYNETCNGKKQPSSAIVYADEITAQDIVNDQKNLCQSYAGLCINNDNQLAPFGYEALERPSKIIIQKAGNN